MVHAMLHNVANCVNRFLPNRLHHCCDEGQSSEDPLGNPENKIKNSKKVCQSEYENLLKEMIKLGIGIKINAKRKNENMVTKGFI